MNRALRYVVSVGDKGDLSAFLKSCKKDQTYVYQGAHGINLYIEKGKVTKVLYGKQELELVDL